MLLLPNKFKGAEKQIAKKSPFPSEGRGIF